MVAELLTDHRHVSAPSSPRGNGQERQIRVRRSFSVAVGRKDQQQPLEPPLGDDDHALALLSVGQAPSAAVGPLAAASSATTGTSRFALLKTIGGVALGISGGATPIVQFGLASLVGAKIGNRLWTAATQNMFLFLTYVMLALPGPSLAATCGSAAAGIRKEPFAFLTFFSGVFGGYCLCTGVLVTPIIGFSLFFVILVTFQILTSLVLEVFGLFWVPKSSKMIITVVGCVVATAGAFCFAWDSLVWDEANFTVSSSFSPLLLAFPAGAGVSCVFLAVGNRKARLLLLTPFRAICLSLSMSTTIVLCAALASDTTPALDLLEPLDWLCLVIAGLSAAYGFFVLVVAPDYIGLAATMGSHICGQLASSLVVDAKGWLGVPVISVTAQRAVGTSCVLCGVIILQMDGHLRCGKLTAGQSKEKIVNADAVLVDGSAAEP